MEALIMLGREGERSETSEEARMRMGTIEEGEEEMSYHFKEEEEVELEEGSSYDLITDVSLTSPVVQRVSHPPPALQLVNLLWISISSLPPCSRSFSSSNPDSFNAQDRFESSSFLRRAPDAKGSRRFPRRRSRRTSSSLARTSLRHNLSLQY